MFGRAIVKKIDELNSINNFGVAWKSTFLKTQSSPITQSEENMQSYLELELKAIS